MQISIQLKRLLKEESRDKHGIITKIAEHTELERHTVAALLYNEAQYVSLNALGKICDYLIEHEGVRPELLPGELLGRPPHRFFDMLARERLQFCLGVRRVPQWPGRRYVMATDARLQGAILSRIPWFGVYPGHVSTGIGHPIPEPRLIPEPHLVPAPPFRRGEERPRSKHEWKGVRIEAQRFYEAFDQNPDHVALISLGSVKANPVVSISLGRTFGVEPHTSQDSVEHVADRKCPIYFRYRTEPHPTQQQDPQPPCCCGGVRLARDTPAERAGIYIEQNDGQWKCFPTDGDQHDAAFVFYVCRPKLSKVELACGGFSGDATGYLAAKLDAIERDLWPPQYITDKMMVGLFIVDFTLPPGPAGDDGRAKEPSATVVHAVDKEVISKRLGPIHNNKAPAANITPRARRIRARQPSRHKKQPSRKGPTQPR